MKFILIDGQTGALLRSAGFREEVRYPVEADVPALSGYFQLMDRVLPPFVGGLIEHTHRDVRLLLK